MATRKKPKKEFEKRIEDFGEEVEALGKRFGKRMKQSAGKKEGIRKVYRSGKEKILGGVCGGIAEYFSIDPIIVRLLWIALCFVWGAGIIIYIIAWIFIPRNPGHNW